MKSVKVKKITTKTGLGYITNASGKVTAKCEFSPGDHDIKEGFTFNEVANKAELDVVMIDTPPPTPEMVWEQKVQAELRLMAEERLIAKGEVKP
jgi:hypothetical protein